MPTCIIYNFSYLVLVVTQCFECRWNGLIYNFEVTTAPQYAMRGHQIGYRDKTNSYCGWDLKQWEKYIRDLVVFGANAVELIPPRSDRIWRNRRLPGYSKTGGFKWRSTGRITMHSPGAA